MSSFDRPSGVTCIDIHEPTRIFPPRGYQTLPDKKPDSLASISDALWGDLLYALNPIVSRLNRGMRTGLSISIASFVVAVGINYIDEEISWSYLIANTIIAFYVIFMLWVINKNRGIDKEILETVDGFKSRFFAEGRDIEYVTKNTGLCRPKTAELQRYLAFPPTDVETQLSVAVAVPEPNHNATIDSTPVAASLYHDDDMKPDFSKTTTTSGTIENPSVVDQMMADLRKPF